MIDSPRDAKCPISGPVRCQRLNRYQHELVCSATTPGPVQRDRWPELELVSPGHIVSVKTPIWSFPVPGNSASAPVPRIWSAHPLYLT